MGKLKADLEFNSEQIEASIKNIDILAKKLSTTLTELDNSVKNMGKVPFDPSLGKKKKELSELQNLYREERKESRLQGFVFRETAQSGMLLVFALTALSNADDSASLQQKKLNQALIQGYAAFQGLDFAIKGVATALGKTPSGLATAFAIIVGAGAALLTYLRSVKNPIHDMTEEINALNKAFEFHNLRLQRFIKGIREYSNKRLISEMTQAFKNIEGIESEILKIDKELTNLPESEETKKRREELERSKKLLETQKKAEEDVVAAVIEQRKIRAGIESSLEQEISLLEEKYKYATTDAEKQKYAKELAQKRAQTEEAAKIRLDKYAQDLIDKGEQEGAIYEQNVEERMRLAELNYQLSGNEDEYISFLKNELSTEKDIVKQKELQLIIQDLLNKKIQDSNKKQIESLDNLQSGLSVLEQGINSIAARSDNLISKLIQAAQIVVQILQLQEAINIRGGTATTGDTLGFIGLGLRMFGLGFAGGGYTGSGSRYAPAGIVHRGEYVFEKPIVDKIGLSNMNNLRSSLQSYAVGGSVGKEASLSLGNSSSILNELKLLRLENRQIREVIASMPPPQVLLQGLLSGQAFLKKEMPTYNKFDKNKHI